MYSIPLVILELAGYLEPQPVYNKFASQLFVYVVAYYFIFFVWRFLLLKSYACHFIGIKVVDAELI